MRTAFRRGFGLPALGQTSAVNVVSVAAGGVSGIIVARTLDADGRGELAIAMVAVQLVAPLLTAGLEESVVFLLAREASRRGQRTIVGSALCAALCLGVVSAILALLLQHLLFVDRTPSVDARYTYAYALMAFFMVFASVQLGVLRGLGNYRLWNCCRLAVPLTFLLAVVIIAGMQASGVLSYLAAMASALVSAAAISSASVLSQGIGLPASELTKKLLRLGSVNHLITVQNVANQRLDIFILAILAPASSVGHYSVATTYASLGLAVGLAPSLQAYSSFSGPKGFLKGIYDRAMRRTWQLMGFTALIVATLAPFAIPLVFGPSFRGAVLPAVVLLFGLPLICANALHVSAWKSVGQPAPAARAELGGLLVNVALMAALIPPFGVLGAALASVAAYAAVKYLLYRVGLPEDSGRRA